jgi:hypothetical protein
MPDVRFAPNLDRLSVRDWKARRLLVGARALSFTLLDDANRAALCAGRALAGHCVADSDRKLGFICARLNGCHHSPHPEIGNVDRATNQHQFFVGRHQADIIDLIPNVAKRGRVARTHLFVQRRRKRFRVDTDALDIAATQELG